MRRLLIFVILFVFISNFVFADDRATGAQYKASDKKEGLKEDFETKVIEKKRMKDSEKVGSYNQPVWTTKRRFPTTRVYLLPENQVEVEYWLLMEGNLEGDTDPKYTGIYEIEYGIGHRLQSDFYFKTVQKDSNAPMEILSQSIELRYGFFNWGEVFGNPSVYVEWIRRSGRPQKGEFKLLLGDEISDRLFWGLNLIYERELGGETGQEYAVSGGVAYSLVDGYLSVGLEGKIVAEDNQSDRFNFFEKKFMLGPSILYKPIPKINFILTSLFGVQMEDKEGEEESKGVYAIYYIAGVDF